MEDEVRDRFISLWRKYFGEAELPIAVYYSDEQAPDAVSLEGVGTCVIEMLPLVIEGGTLCLSGKSRMCGGARRYMGFSDEIPRSDFEYFLSHGIPGKVEGERFKKSPELVREFTKSSAPFKAPKPFIVFKRWDKLTDKDVPEVVVFFALHDVLAGLFMLANYDEAEPNAVICPFGSGCSSIVHDPFVELRSERPRCIMGMFDISARPYIGKDRLSFSVPFPKFRRMMDNMDESFLVTNSWKALRERME